MRAARAVRWWTALLAVSLASSGLSCTSFDLFKGPGDAGAPTKVAHDATTPDAVARAASDARVSDAPRCTTPWQQTSPDASCSDRQLFSVTTGVGPIQLLHIARAFDGDVAILYGVSVDAGVALTLMIVDPVTHDIRHTQTIASAPSFDSAAISYDDHGTLSIAYHAAPGDGVVYVAMDGGLEAAPPETVVADASASLLALSTIPSAADAGTPGPLGFVDGTVGIAWFPAPPAPNDFSLSFLHLFARQSTGWNDVEQYGYTQVRSDLTLQPNAQLGVVASGVEYSADPTEPYEGCTWEMAGRVSQCGPSGQLYGLSLSVGATDAYRAYTFPDPTTGVTTLDVATDTDGTYTFPLLSTVTTFPDAVTGGQAEPRAGLVGSTLAIAVAYPTRDLTHRVDFATWDVDSGAATTERVTTVTTSGSATPALDLVIDKGGVPTFAIADPGSGTIYLARAVLPSASSVGSH